MLVIYLEGNWAKELDNISQLASQFELNPELLFFFLRKLQRNRRIPRKDCTQVLRGIGNPILIEEF